MENKPSLSRYFDDSKPPPASQFFDQIGNTSADMIQSVYLGNPEDQEPQPSNLFTTTMPVSFSQTPDLALPEVTTSVASSTAVPATSLPDPSTFFDNIPDVGIVSAGPEEVITQAMEGLNVQAEPVDKEAERRRDAWIPNEEAKKTLMKAQSSPHGSFFPEREVLTMPGIVFEEELSDSLHSVAVSLLGVADAGARGAVRADHVSRDELGLKELLRTGCLRAALNLTRTLIAALGQGAGRIGRPTKHSQRSLQLWLTRFAVMVRIKMHDVLSKEAEAFGDLNKPDMFYQFYPEAYGSKSGSLVPFALRLLIAELPAHVGKPEVALDRLYGLLAVVKKMLSNLSEGKTEDGSGTVSDRDKSESMRFWTSREIRIVHSIVNTAVVLKEFRLALQSLQPLLRNPNTSIRASRHVSSAAARLCLRAGHVTAAVRHVTEAREKRVQICPTPDVREYVDSSLIDIAHGDYQSAYNNLVKAADQEPTNIMVANNLAVCLLYMGRLKDAIAVFQKAINSDPERGLNENLLLNLCTLYELESSNTNEKKLNLLRMLCKYKSDTFPNVLECLKLNA